MNQNDHELIAKVYQAQKRKPDRNDWSLAIKADKVKICLTLSEEKIKSMSDKSFKALVKKKLRAAAFKDPNEKKETHLKVKNIQYLSLEIQKYLNDKKFNMNEKQLLFRLRTKMTNVKANFKHMHLQLGNLHCNLCVESYDQTQSHLLVCSKIVSSCQEAYDNISIEHNFIYGTIEQQLAVTKLYQKIFESIEDISSN